MTSGARQKVSVPPSGVSFPPLSRYSTIHVLGTGDTIIILGIFTDLQLSSPLENRPVPLGKPLYVVLRATNSDPDRFALVANEVFASTNISSTGAVKASPPLCEGEVSVCQASISLCWVLLYLRAQILCISPLYP